MHGDPDMISPRGVRHGIRALGGPTQPPPGLRRAGPLPVPERRSRGRGRGGNVLPWIGGGEGRSHVIVSTGICSSLDRGVARLIHHDDALYPRLLVLHWLLGCRVRPVE